MRADALSCNHDEKSAINRVLALIFVEPSFKFFQHFYRYEQLMDVQNYVWHQSTFRQFKTMQITDELEFFH